MSTALLRVKVEPVDGEPFVVEVLSRDVLRWEQRGGGRSYTQVMDRGDMVPMYELAWIAAQRAGQYSGSEAAFQSSCDITGADEGAAAKPDADPTQRARSRASRSRSR